MNKKLKVYNDVFMIESVETWDDLESWQNDYSFVDWLKEFKGVDRPVGDLADDVFRDNDFPDSTYDEMLEYLEYEAGASNAAIDTFKKAYIAYKMGL